MKDNNGFEFFDVEKSKDEKVHADFVSMPFTGLISSIEKGEVLPLIVHKAGHNGFGLRQEKIQQVYDDLIETQTKKWGESSPWTADWLALNKATNNLVKGVIDGNLNQVKEALQKGADPQMTVEVKDPCALKGQQDSSYVALPIGVASLLRGKEKYASQQDKDVLNNYKEIAHLLLSSQTKCSIEVGNHPDGSGQSALSYKAFGLSLYGSNSGSETLETRVVTIPLSLRTALGSLLPNCLVDDKVTPATEGMVYGEDIPKQARNNYMDLIDPKEISLTNSVEKFRLRQAQKKSVLDSKSNFKFK